MNRTSLVPVLQAGTQVYSMVGGVQVWRTWAWLKIATNQSDCSWCPQEGGWSRGWGTCLVGRMVGWRAMGRVTGGWVGWGKEGKGGGG